MPVGRREHPSVGSLQKEDTGRGVLKQEVNLGHSQGPPQPYFL